MSFRAQAFSISMTSYAINVVLCMKGRYRCCKLITSAHILLAIISSYGHIKLQGKLTNVVFPLDSYLSCRKICYDEEQILRDKFSLKIKNISITMYESFYILRHYFSWSFRQKFLSDTCTISLFTNIRTYDTVAASVHLTLCAIVMHLTSMSQ